MPQDFLVHEAAAQGLGQTHAIVIGVGAYPHLNGGTGQRTEDHGGMGQLTSPPISARLFASWLIKSFKHPDKPLATVSLLLAEPNPLPFVDPVNNAKKKAIKPADSTNVRAAVEQWFDRGNTNPNNLLIFYFCGHGIAAGTDTALLLADYGFNTKDSLEGAIDFRRFRLGMNRCRANEQCFFVDACRTESDTLIQAGAAGRYIITPGVRDPEWAPRMAPVFYATMNGYKAYALRGEPSVYTDALLKSLRDLAANDEEGDWRVSTERLQGAINHVIKRRALEITTLVPPTSDDAASIFINYLDTPPSALVYVKTEPAEAISQASLAYQPEGKPITPAPPIDNGRKELVLELPAGSYDFTAKFPPDRSVTQRDSAVRPIYRTVTFRVPS
jgi:Caspase domain